MISAIAGPDGRTLYVCPCGFRSEFLSIWTIHAEHFCDVYKFRTDPKTILTILQRQQ